MTALDHYLLRAYLDGELDAAASEAFELLLLERPDLAEMVDADSALRLGLASAAKAAGGSAADPAAGAGANVVPLHRPARWAPLAMAASLLLAVGVGGGWLLRVPPQVAGGAQLLYVDKTRSGDAATAARVGATRPVVLMVPVAQLDACEARIEVQQPGRAPLVTTAVPDEYGYASVVIAAGALQGGQALVRVSCGDGAAAEYPIEIKPAS